MPEVAQLSEIILTPLQGSKEIEEVAIGSWRVLEGIKAGGIYVNLSTSRLTLIRQIEPLFRLIDEGSKTLGWDAVSQVMASHPRIAVALLDQPQAPTAN